LELEDGGENSKINPYQENSFFFVGVICPSRAVKGELQHPIELCQPGEAKSIADNAAADVGRVMRREKAFLNAAVILYLIRFLLSSLGHG